MPIKGDDLGRQLKYLHILARSAAPNGELAPDLDFGPTPSPLLVSVKDANLERHLSDARDRWIAVKLCAGRLPDDPIRAGQRILGGLDQLAAELSTDLAALQRDSADRAPDGGRWFPWAMEHPDGSVSLDEAKERDFRAGSAEAYLEPIQGLGAFRRSLRLSFLLIGFSRALPVVLGIAVAHALDEVLPPWPAILAALGIWFAVDKVLVELFVKGMLLDPWRRGLLDRAADQFADDAGMAMVSAALSRQDAYSRPG